MRISDKRRNWSIKVQVGGLCRNQCAHVVNYLCMSILLSMFLLSDGCLLCDFGTRFDLAWSQILITRNETTGLPIFHVIVAIEIWPNTPHSCLSPAADASPIFFFIFHLFASFPAGHSAADIRLESFDSILVSFVDMQIVACHCSLIYEYDTSTHTIDTNTYRWRRIRGAKILSPSRSLSISSYIVMRPLSPSFTFRFSLAIYFMDTNIR